MEGRKIRRKIPNGKDAIFNSFSYFWVSLMLCPGNIRGKFIKFAREEYQVVKRGREYQGCGPVGMHITWKKKRGKQ